MTVNPRPVMNDPADVELCHNDNLSVTFTTPNTGGTTTYTWTATGTDNIGGLEASGSGNINATVTNTTNAPITATITVTPHYASETAPSTTCDEGESQTFTVTVNPRPVMNTPENQELCSATDLNVTFGTTITDGTVTYEWTRDNTTNVTGTANGTGDIIDLTLVNVTNEPQTTTFTVTPHYTSGTDAEMSCNEGVAQTFEVTVRPSILTEGNVTFVGQDTTVVLRYGVSDTLIELERSWTNNMINMNVRLDSVGVTYNHRYRVGTHVITWMLIDECNDTVRFEQQVTVSYPPCGFLVYDADDNAYPTGQIGSNCWTLRNARSVNYWERNSDLEAPIIPDPMQYPGTGMAPWDTVYGKLYTYWAATGLTPTRAVPPAQVRGICPMGWHIPDDDDFIDLMSNYEGAELMSSESGHWLDPGTDDYGFTLEPGGYYNPELDRYEYLHVKTILWSYTPGATIIYHACEFGSACGTIEIIPTTANAGYSVRCVHD